MNPRARAAVSLLGLTCAWACAGTPGGSTPKPGKGEPAARWHYEVRVSPELRSLEATVCFEGPMPRELRAGKDEAASRLRHARWLSPGPVRGLRVERGRIQLGRAAEDGCVGYRVDLAEGGSLGAAVRRVGASLLMSPNAWLWRPERRASGASATLVLHMAEGLRASLPWPKTPDGARYVLDEDAFAFDSQAAIGALRVTHGERDGIPFEAAALDATLAPEEPVIAAWMRNAIDLASAGPAGFPAPRLHALLVPATTDGAPVAFGSVTRGGVGSVLLFVSPKATLPSLERDWVLPHELSHLFLPYVAREHAWFSEGAATYYQEVLRARAGVLSPEEALLNIARSTQSAAREGTGRTLRAESRDMHSTYAFRPVYWAGAAYFLMADVALRQASAGEKSLDSVLRALKERAGAGRPESLDALLARMDDYAEMPIFRPLAEACLKRAFPALDPVLAQLGVRQEGDARWVAREAELAAVREGIFGGRSASAHSRPATP